MSMFHAAAQPKVQLRKRAVRLRDYLDDRIWRPAMVVDCIEVMEDIISVLDGNPDGTDLEYARMMIDAAEASFPAVINWRKPMSDDAFGALALTITGAAGILAGWLSWKYPTEPVTVFALPIMVVDPDELLAVRNAKAA